MKEFTCLSCNGTCFSSASLKNQTDPRCPYCGSFLIKEKEVKPMPRLSDYEVTTIHAYVSKGGMPTTIVTLKPKEIREDDRHE